MKEYTKEEMDQIRFKLNGETAMDRMKRKAREEPFVPAGVALTCFALVAATIGIKTGNRAYANNMFRLRGRKEILENLVSLFKYQKYDEDILV